MSMKDFALRTAYDLFHWKASAEPFSEIILEGTSSQQQQQQCNTSNSPLTWMDAMVCQVIKSTGQRDNNGNRVRRACSIKEPGCDGRPGTKQCSHPSCVTLKKAGNNRFGDTFGVFVCENIHCQKKHWENVAAQSRLEME